MTRGFSVLDANGEIPQDIDGLWTRNVQVEAGTEALVLVDMSVELDRAIVSALWAIDDGDHGLAVTSLLAALEQARSRD